MRIWDVSVPLNDRTHLYPGMRQIEVTWLERWETGSDHTLSHISLSSHTGTHVDAPLHFIPGGSTLDEIPLERLAGPAKVLDLTAHPGPALDAGALKAAGLDPGITLLKTKNSALWAKEGFQADYVYLDPEAARAAVAAGVTTLGIDYLSVDSPDSREVHHILLGAGVIIIEGLNLSSVSPGEYIFVGLPMRLEGVEGSPVRALLLGLPPRPRKLKCAGEVV
jgi:arylformamidase